LQTSTGIQPVPMSRRSPLRYERVSPLRYERVSPLRYERVSPLTSHFSALPARCVRYPWPMTRLEQLRAQAEEIRQIAARHKAHSVAVFGSVARGEDGPDSDVDILVDCEPDASLGDLYLLQQELAEYLNVSVDLIDRGGLKPRDKHIRDEALAL
jgi:predicted nucleotidyltransferase